MNQLNRKANSLSRYFLWHFLSKKINYIHVAEYPKSGGTWLTQLISDYFDYENRRNKFPKLERSVLHGHYKYDKSFNVPICMIRDGRDIAVSYYHHMIIGHARSHKKIIVRNRNKLCFDNYNDVEKNLPRFIEYLNKDYKDRLNGFTWSEFIKSYLDKPEVLFVKYEDMLINAEKELIQVLSHISNEEINLLKLRNTIEKYSFKNQTKRNPGQENKKSFLRKGISGDWKNYFNIEASQMFDYYCGNELIDLGYEKDNSWVNINEKK